MAESHYPIKPLDLEGVSTYPLADRKSKVDAQMFAKPPDGSDTIPGFIAKLPHILAAESFRNLIRAIFQTSPEPVRPLRMRHRSPRWCCKRMAVRIVSPLNR